ncbi:hypothetical protein ACHAXT_004634 [Thalassiosira profunda]
MAQEPAPSTASVVLLCGLPGCGKSTFAKTLIDLHMRRCNQHTNGNGVGKGDVHGGQQSYDAPVISRFDKIAHVDYDSITQKELDRCNKDTDGSSDSQTSHAPFDANDLEAWRRSRVRALKELRDTLVSHFCGDTNASSLLVVMDDNFHLRSMRREVYRTCQEVVDQHPAQIGYSSIYFATPLEACIQRNSARNGKERIPPDVMHRMAANMEPPDETKPYASFERSHVTFDNSNSSEIDSKSWQEVDQCIQKSLQSPIPRKKVLTEEEIAQMEEEKARQREETLNCQTHRADQLLRKLVGAVGRVDKKRSKEANNTRKSIMETIRKEDVTIDMSDESLAQQFACSILGVEATIYWRDSDDPIAVSINDALQQFQLDRKTRAL